MTKLKMIRLYNAETVPEHIFEEICELVEKMGIAFEKSCEGHSSNIILSAFNRFHAGLICALVTENGLEEATKTEMIGLGKNVEHMSGKKFFPFEDKDEN